MKKKLFSFPDRGMPAKKKPIIQSKRTQLLAVQFLVFAVGFSAFGNENTPVNYAHNSIPKGWRILPANKQSNAIINRDKESSKTWYVSKLGSEVVALDTHNTEKPLLAANDSVKIWGRYRNKFDMYVRGLGGYVAGLDLGEFGGGLFFIDSSLHQIRPIRFNPAFDYKNAQFIDSFAVGVYALCGIAHLGLDSGALVEMQNIKGEISAKIVAYLPSSPRVAQKINDSEMVYLDRTAVRIIQTNGKAKKIADFRPLKDSYPNTIIFDNGNILIGMENYISFYDAKSKQMHLLEPIKKQ